MDEDRLKELESYGIYHFTFFTSWRGKKKTSYFGTHQSHLDNAHPRSTRKKCACCQKLSYRWQGSDGVYVCYDGCFSTTGYDSRTPDGWPQWIERDGRGIDQTCTS